MTEPPTPSNDQRITLRAILVGCFCAGLFAYLTVRWEQRPPQICITATQIAPLPYLLLMASVLLVNPLLRLLRFIRPLTTAELLTIFMMGTVSSGISTFGLASQLVPTVSGLSNPAWNNQQNRWDIYVQPYLNERYFLAEPGLREASCHLRDAEFEYRRVEQQRQQAAACLDARERVAKLTAAGRTPDQRELAIAQRELDRTSAAWRAGNWGADPAAALAVCQRQLPELARTRETQQAAMTALTARSFVEVTLFRRGLPPGQRAIPGFIYVPGEGWDTYRDRWQRTWAGRAARHRLAAVEPRLLATTTAVPVDLLAQVDAATEQFRLLGDDTQLTPAVAAANARIDELQATRVAAEANLRDLQRLRHLAVEPQLTRLDDECRDLQRQVARLPPRLDRAQRHRERLQQRLLARTRVATVAAALTKWRADLANATAADYPRLAAELHGHVQALAQCDTTIRRLLVGDVPWSAWVRPLARWMVLVLLTYLVLMCLNVLLFRQWALHEKLIYPLAELPQTLAGSGDSTPGGIPAVFQSRLFWAGFAISASVVGWNLMCKNRWLNSGPIPLVYDWGPYVYNSIFSGWSANIYFQIFFTLIGISFLIPVNVSRSLWMFFFLYLAELLVLVWWGYGQHENSFPSHWASTMNFRFAQGGGALLVFAAVVLWRCRRYLTCGFHGSVLMTLPLVEQQELRWASRLFIVGSALLVFLLSWSMGANLVYTLICYVLILVITIGLVRAVAEGGLPMVRPFFGPWHLIRSFVGMDRSWTFPGLFAPLIAYYGVLFLDIKTFIAPAMSDALKIRSDQQLARRRFYLALVGAIACAILVAFPTHLIIAYQWGADTMNLWFYTNFPQYHQFGAISLLTKTPPAVTAGMVGWLLVGALLMAGLLYGRQSWFWLPHPIGLVMMINSHMNNYWSSILVGWAAKALVVRYGNRETYFVARNFFIGLIAGELFMCLFGATLNR